MPSEGDAELRLEDCSAGRRQADDEIPAPWLRLLLGEPGFDAGATEAHAAFEHRLDHDLLSERR